MNEEIKKNYSKVIENIRSLDKEKRVTFLCATKTQTVEDINYLISLGCKCIGENRVNELLEKYEKYDKSAELHFIGTLQKNKVKYIIDKVSLIHSVDTLSLLEEIDKRASKIGKIMDVLLEVNSGREESKGGIMPEDVCDFYEKAKEYKKEMKRKNSPNKAKTNNSVLVDKKVKTKVVEKPNKPKKVSENALGNDPRFKAIFEKFR